MASTISPTTEANSVAPAQSNAAPLIVTDDEAAFSRSLIFRVAGYVFCCNVAIVREVIPAAQLTRLPGADTNVLGLMNVRGTVVTVVDGAMLLRGVPCERDTAAVLLVDAGSRGVGFAVDSVLDVRRIREDEEYVELDLRAAVARVVNISEDE